jgi:hypothetical protein
MTFAPTSTAGTALLVPCLIEGDSTALQIEAEALWGAEDNTGAKRSCISTTWGSVGALFRAGTSASDIASWSDYFRACGAETIGAIDHNGLLTIPWPERVDGQVLDCDVLLATGNAEKELAAPEDVAAAWIAEGHEEYFFENVGAGIRTPDDERIWRKMVGELAWVTSRDSRFASTIEALRNQFPTKKGANVRYFAPELWSPVDRFARLYQSTYTFPPRIRGCLAGASAHFERALLLREISYGMIAGLQLDRAELEANGYTHAENGRKLTAVVESAITSLYSSLDCGRQVVTHVFAKHRGLADSTRTTFQRAGKGEIDPTLPPRILQAFTVAPWYPNFRRLRDTLTHGGTGSCHRDEKTGKVMYFNEAVRDQERTHIPDIFTVLDEYIKHVGFFLDQVFTALVETLKDNEVEQVCGFFGGLVYLRRLRPSEAIDLHSGRCESHVWFDLPGKHRCPLATTCGAYQRRQLPPVSAPATP